VVECAGLEIRYTGLRYRGFESLPFRQDTLAGPLTVGRRGTVRECSRLFGRDVTQPARTLSASAIYAARRRAAWPT
jgi:hypothetical protein